MSSAQGMSWQNSRATKGTERNKAKKEISNNRDD